MKKRLLCLLLTMSMLLGMAPLSGVFASTAFTTSPVSVPTTDDASHYLSFTAEENASTVELVSHGDVEPISLEYSIDGENFFPYVVDNIAICLDEGETVYFRGENDHFSSGDRDFYGFEMSGSLKARGSVTSLLSHECGDIPLSDFAFSHLFYGCDSLTAAPALPSTELGAYAYYEMFTWCTSLKQIPVLPAEKLSEGCYYAMFCQCDSLTEVSIIPATTLDCDCCCEMFAGCDSLVKAPILPANTLAPYCYQQMFDSCTALKVAPALPAAELADGCYTSMFDGCSNLQVAPVLAATDLADSCYSAMFRGCVSLTEPPQLPAVNLPDYCYHYMFDGCTNLSKIPALPVTIPGNYSLGNMFSGCSSLCVRTQKAEGCNELIFYANGENDRAMENMLSGTSGKVSTPEFATTYYVGSHDFSGEKVRELPNGTVIRHCSNSDCEAVGYMNGEGEPVTGDLITDYLCFTALEPNSTVSLTCSASFGVVDDLDLLYSFDAVHFFDFILDKTVITLKNIGDKVYFKGNNTKINPLLGFDDDGNLFDVFCSFSMTGKIAASGNVMSLLSTSTPDVPLSPYCFAHLFNGCRALVSAPELPALDLAEECYFSMFSGCTSLEEAPELPAENLAEYCYMMMFSDCTSLEKAPALPADSLSQGCYAGMFVDCTALRAIPELSASDLASWCYGGMFSGCSQLCVRSENAAGCTALTIPANDCFGATEEMFDGAGGVMSPESGMTYYVGLHDFTGDIVYSSDHAIRKCTNSLCDYIGYMEENGVPVLGDMNTDYLCLTAEEPRSTVEMIISDEEYFDGPIDVELSYSTDGIHWKPFYINETVVTLKNVGDKIYLKGDNTSFSPDYGWAIEDYYPEDYTSFYHFVLTGRIAASGDVTSLMNVRDAKVSLAPYCFAYLFAECDALTSAPTMPEDGLAEGCFAYMFSDCTSLTTAPALPSHELTDNCYAYMFIDCTSLSSAPALPSHELADYCYAYMFDGCTSLTSAPELPATALACGCYADMFAYCTSLSSAPELPATELADYCYWYMFDGCTELTTAPALPVTELASGCYDHMFAYCTKLTTAPALPATELADNCYTGMFEGCASLTTAPELPATALANRCYSCMFADCTALTTAPELPATELAYSCYDCMFAGCTALTSATELPATELTEACYHAMFRDCISLTTAPALPATKLDNWCYEAMFDDCTALTTAPELPATELAYGCYESMFSGCTALKNAPELPAHELAVECYGWMFLGCTSLTSAPELPANELADSCYYAMFRDCISLTTAPELPAAELADDCYAEMFSGCVALTSAPELPAVEMKYDCYYCMFYNCASLEEAPALPAVILDAYCYQSMFEGCRSLKNAPALPATELFRRCYDSMFKGCVSLQRAPELPESDLANGCYEEMFRGCMKLCISTEPFDDSVRLTIPDTGIDEDFFYLMFDGTGCRDVTPCSGVTYYIGSHCFTGDIVCEGTGTQPAHRKCRNIDCPFIGYQDETGVPVFAARNTDYLCLTAVDPNATVSMENDYYGDYSGFCNLEYSLDGVNFESFVPNQTVITLKNAGDKVYFRGIGQGVNAEHDWDDEWYYDIDYDCFNHFVLNGRIAASGDVTSLVNIFSEEALLTPYCLAYLFAECDSLVSAPRCPSTDLARGCYAYMFSGCTSLVTPPELPADELAEWCYHGMFMGCSALAEAPDLPATVLPTGCYADMLTGTECSITIRGDFNGDYAVDRFDAIYLLYYSVFGEEFYPCDQSADMDGNSIVDRNDAIYLLFHTVFPESYPLTAI